MRRAGVWRIVILTLNGEGPNSATILPSVHNSGPSQWQSLCWQHIRNTPG